MTRHLLISALAASLISGTASADTLREALNATYQTNPTLNAQRESLKSTDATVAIARSGGLPTVTSTLGVSRDLSRSGTTRLQQGPERDLFLSGGAELNVPFYKGGSVLNSVKAAKTRVEAGRATLRAVEGDVFVEAVAAYMDVMRDRAIVELNNNNVRVLGTNLEANRDRFQIGDLTRTDVAQSEARLADGRSRLAVSQGRLTTSEENYRRVIGQNPGPLAPPPPLPPLPATPDEAVRIALVDNPDNIAAVRTAQAARYDVRAERAGRLPTISGTLSGDYVRNLSDNNFVNDDNEFVDPPNAGTATTVGILGRIPLYQGGLPAARIRRSQALEGQALELQIATERAVIANTRSAFASYQAALQAITSSESSVKANELALEGVRAENSVGTRNILDVLNAEQELLNSQVLLVTARRDAYVAGFQLLNAMGQAEAADLGLDGGPLYDPLGNYRRVAGDVFDWSSDRRHTPVSTRTVTPAEQPRGVTPTPR